MANEVASTGGRIPVEQASIKDSYLDIPDETNPAILDARKTFLATVIGAVLFIGAILLFIL
ncbi:MAG: hypothetical protein R3E98_19580 [Gemmatimonadota bacterium]|nr:hypothetical protein [Gemmatimonadota bacterium]